MATIILSYTIDAENAPEALAAFLAMFPNITLDLGDDEDGNPIVNQRWAGDPLTDEGWMAYKVKAWLDSVIDQGRRKVDLRDNYVPPATKAFVR